MYSKELIERYRKVALASVCDACDEIVEDRRCFMNHTMRPRVSERRMVGPAVTLLLGAGGSGNPPEQLFSLMDDESKEGDVMVLSLNTEDLNIALWGGLMTAGAVANNLEGAVLNCGVRDLPEIRRDFSQFEIFSNSIVPVSIIPRAHHIARNVPMECAGVTVNPGDLIVGDIDGVVCVPKEHVETVLARAEEIDEMEGQQTQWIAEMKSFRKGLAKFNRY